MFGRAVAGVALPAIAGVAGGESAISASRATLATIEAALISGTVASPPTTHATGRSSPAGDCRRPGRARGRTPRRSTARRIASRVAPSMLSRSISLDRRGRQATMASLGSRGGEPRARRARQLLGVGQSDQGRRRITAATTTGPGQRAAADLVDPGHRCRGQDGGHPARRRRRGPPGKAGGVATAVESPERREGGGAPSPPSRQVVRAVRATPPPRRGSPRPRPSVRCRDPGRGRAAR